MKTTILTIVAILFSVSAYASKKCEANFTHNSTSYTGWKYIGEVSGLDKKKECKEKSLAQASSIVKANISSLNFPALSSSNWSNYCANGITVYVDTQVEGKKNSKDGSTNFKPTCGYGNGDCKRYAQVFDGGSF